MRAMASTFCASAPRPYTVSVGKATRPPSSKRWAARCIAACTASSKEKVILRPVCLICAARSAGSMPPPGFGSERLEPDAQRRGGLARAVAGCVKRRAQDRYVAHLAAGPGVGLAVKMQLGARHAQHAGPIGLAILALGVAPHIAQDIQHDRGAQAGRVAQGLAGHDAG